MAINPLQGTFHVLCRVGLSSDIPPLKLAEIGWDTDTNTFRVGNGTASPAKIPTNLSTEYVDYSNSHGFKFSKIDLVEGGKVDGVDVSQLKKRIGFVRYNSDDSFDEFTFISDGKVIITEVGNNLQFSLSNTIPTASQISSLEGDINALSSELTDFETQFSGTGIALGNGTGSVVLKGIESPDNTVLVTQDSDSINLVINPASGVFAQLMNLYNAAVASDGFLVRSGVNFVNRIWESSSDLTITNPAGYAGNPSISLSVPTQSEIDSITSTKYLSSASLNALTIGGTLFNSLAEKFAASNLETITGTSVTKFTTPSSINALLTSKIASQGEVNAGIINDKFGTPLTIKTHIDNRIAIQSEIATGTDTTKFPSAKAVKDYVSTVIPASLAFTPVEQGGGAGQGTNKLRVGWLGSLLGLQVDTTDYGGSWPINSKNITDYSIDQNLSTASTPSFQTLRVANTSYPKIIINSTGNSVDAKKWQEYVNPTGDYILETLNDAENSAVSSLIITRAGVATLGGNTLLTSSNFSTYAASLAGSYSNPSWITALAGSKITGDISGNAANISAFSIDQNLAVTSSVVHSQLSAIGIPTGGSGAIASTTGAGQLMTQGVSGSAAFMSFHRPGSYAINFGLDTDNVLKIGGWSFGASSQPILHGGNFSTYAASLAGSYSNPSWITALAGSKITGDIAGKSSDVTITIVKTITGSYDSVTGSTTLTITKNTGAVQSIVIPGVSGGSGGSCFLKDSIVIMADGSTKEIQNVEIGDFVLGRYGEVNEVLALDKPLLNDRFIYNINEEHFTTDEHTFFTEKGPSYLNLDAHDDDMAMGYQEVIVKDGSSEFWKFLSFQNTKVYSFKEGDFLVHKDGMKLVSSIEKFEMPPSTQLYNLVLNGSHTYWCNGYLVGGFIRDDDFDYVNWKQLKKTNADDYRDLYIDKIKNSNQ